MSVRYCVLPAILLLLIPAQWLAAQVTPNAALQQRVIARLEAREADLIAIRRDLHQHPEVSGAEERTAGVVAAGLRDLGLEVRTGVGGHGVVGLLRGGKPGPMVAFRADMDAVPSHAPDPVEFRSLTPGVRHICGHDLHTTIGLAIAEGLAAVRGDLSGSVMLVFQPAEERATGARAMLADGVFGSGRPEAIYAVHTAPLPVGQLGTTPGVLMASRDNVLVTLTGTGNLKAAADSARKIIESVSTVTLAQALEPGPRSAIFVLSAQPTRAPDGSWTVGASISVASLASTARARDAITQGVAALGFPDVAAKAAYQERVVAGVTNDSTLVDQANAAIRSVLGEQAVVPVDLLAPAFSEDFGSFQELVPGVLWFLGVSNPAKGWVGMPHSPGYVADEGAILVAAQAMTAAILNRLGR